MGEIAAQSILRRITQPAEEADALGKEVVVEPELIIRETTAVARARSNKQSQELRKQA